MDFEFVEYNIIYIYFFWGESDKQQSMPELSKSWSLFLFMGLVYYLRQTKGATVRITFTILYWSI